MHHQQLWHSYMECRIGEAVHHLFFIDFFIVIFIPPTHNRFTALLDFVRDYPGEPAQER